MTNFDFLPVLDFRNDGWSLTGSGVTNLWQAWNNTDDSKYASCPSHKGKAFCSFPVDTTSIPDGAVITSVTVLVRVNRTISQSVSVTVNLSCLDDTSRFTSRTIYPGQTIVDIEIGTYQRDCLGFEWTIHRLNKLLFGCFSFSLIFGCIRIYKVICRINYRVRPTIAVTQPTGTVFTPSPTIAWTYSQADGDPQSKAQYKIFTASVQEQSNFNPETSTPVFSGQVNGDLTSFTLPFALVPENYYVYVRAFSSFHAKSVWVGRAFTVQGPAPGPPGGGVEGQIGTGNGGFISVVPDSATSSVALTLRDTSNLLSVQQADFETSRDYLGYEPTNATLTRDLSTFYTLGVGSMKMAAASAATMSATSSFAEISPTAPITARAQFKAAATGRTVNVKVLFFDSTFTSIAGTLTGTGTDSSSTWTEVTVTGTTPDTAAYAQVQVQVVSPANAEVHNVDAIGLLYGTSTVWSNGGHSSRNLLSAAAATGDDPVDVEPWTPTVGTTYTRAATTGTGSHGAKAFRLTYAGISPSISFVAAGTVFSDTTTGTGYTLNKPAGLADGDLLLAYVMSTESGIITPPSGWTLVNTASIDDGSTDTALWVMKKDGLAADPSTWVGNVGTSSTRRRAVVVAYRGTAPAASQFIAENTSTQAADVLALNSATITNTDSNAWRAAVFATNDNASGSWTVNQNAPFVGISYVGSGTQWSNYTDSLSYTLNRPSNVVAGDLMIAAVACSGSITTISAPSGWTVVRKTTSAGTQTTLAIMTRTAGVSEPTSWSGTRSNAGASSNDPVVTNVVAYRAAADASLQFVAENATSNTSSNNITTPVVTNTDSESWRICVFAGNSTRNTNYSNALRSYTETEISERNDQSAQLPASPFWHYDTQGRHSMTLAMSDSNGKVSTGSHSKTGTLSSGADSQVAWIGLIKVNGSPPTPVPNETERDDGTTGASNPFLTAVVVDSNAVVSTGSKRLTGTYAPSAGTDTGSTASWIGMIKPATPIVAGTAEATLVNYVDIQNVDPFVLDMAENKVTIQASFLGSTGGTPYLKMYFYRANELLQTQISQGTSFGTTTWVKSVATFEIPEGTTRFKAGVSITDRLINDLVYYDRVSIAFGDSPVWRNGTGRDTHPIWSIPLIEYADDDGTGYGDWRPLPGTVNDPPLYDQLSGIALFTDHTPVPLNSRKYRARTLSFGLAGDRFVSGYGAETDETTLFAEQWWLKDLKNPDNNMQLKVQTQPVAADTTGTATVFQPLGEKYPVVVGEGYKADTIECTLILTRSEYAQLRDLFDSGKTLFLQTNLDNAWWVRPVGNLDTETKPTGQMFTNPLRWVKVQFVQVAPEV